MHQYAHVCELKCKTMNVAMSAVTLHHSCIRTHGVPFMCLIHGIFVCYVLTCIHEPNVHCYVCGIFDRVVPQFQYTLHIAVHALHLL